MTLTIREARPADAELVLGFIRALAEYEKLLDEVGASLDQVRETLFAAEPRVFGLIAEWDGRPAGFALWFYTYSTFQGRHGIWLEDLFVDPALRGKGIGKALLRVLAERCAVEGLGRLEWAVLDWNEPSIRFYESLGARSINEWLRFRLSGPSLGRMVEGR